MEPGDRNTNTWKTILKVMGLLMAFLYLFIGVFLIVYGPDVFRVQPPYLLVFGSMMVTYGVFRCYRIYRQHANEEK